MLLGQSAPAYTKLFWLTASLVLGTILPATAADTFIPDVSIDTGIASVSLIIVLVIITAVTALLHLTGRRKWVERETSLLQELHKSRTKLDQAHIFLAAERQIIVAFGALKDEANIVGDLTLVSDTSIGRRLLAFGSWTNPSTAQHLDSALTRLRERGEAFRLSVTTLENRFLEVEGRAVGGQAVMRIRDVSGDRLELARLKEHYEKTVTQLDALQILLNSIQEPVWIRDSLGALKWVNHAYVNAVDGKDSSTTICNNLELFDGPIRDDSIKSRKNGEIWHCRNPAVVHGERRMLDAIEIPLGDVGSTGMARDLSELMSMRADLERQMQSHTTTLDRLSTAVAIFDGNKRLVFHNSAYRQLWNLPIAFLEQVPTDSEILDRLRAAHQLPEQADYRAWKSALLSAYHSVETFEQTWHLPDARILRVVITPNLQTGITYLFDNVTERFNLESRYNGLIRVQGETLDTLKEGVAVFGTDGRLKLHNPAFARLWKIDPQRLNRSNGARNNDDLHIDQVIQLCNEKHQPLWVKIRDMVVGLPEMRTTFNERVERQDETILEGGVIPLPDGATLLTFSDITSAVKFERALTERNQALLERNQALVDAEKLRNDFVHHVSYELRSPLTNIIGFTQLLAEGTVGPLNQQQQEYAGFVMKSSTALMAIINDILDLATIDMDAMELDITDVDIKEAIRGAIAGVQDRLGSADLNIQIVARDTIGTMQADSKRLRQILFNLLANAVGFSEPGQTITVAALRRENEIVFKVSDQGRGIPTEALEKVFNRFLSRSSGSSHRGVGLGLSIVKSFVELHGGIVTIQSALGEGTVVTCIFPTRINLDVSETQQKSIAARDLLG